MKQRQAGLTIIEVLVAITIFAVVSSASLALFPALFRANASTRDDQAITLAAKSYFESVKSRWLLKNSSTLVPYFQTDASPPSYSSTISGVSCTPSGSTKVANTAGTPVIRTVNLSCSTTSGVTYAFTADFGGPL